MAPFYGCLAMALLAVGGGALTVGRDWIGTEAAVALDAVLFTAGTAVGLAAAVAVPYLMAVRHRVQPAQATPVWLLPVVAPMVSAALGPLLVPHLPAGQPRETLLLACFAMFGLSLLATLVMLPLVFARLVTGGPLPLALTPTLFLVLGPLGPVHHRRRQVRGRGARCRPGRLPRRASTSSRSSTASPSWASPCCGSALATAHVVRARRHGHALRDDLVGVHLPGRHLCHGRGGAGPAHGARSPTTGSPSSCTASSSPPGPPPPCTPRAVCSAARCSQGLAQHPWRLGQ